MTPPYRLLAALQRAAFLLDPFLPYLVLARPALLIWALTIFAILSEED